MRDGIGRQPFVELATCVGDRQPDVAQAPARERRRRRSARHRLLLQLRERRVDDPLGDAALSRAAAIVGGELGWSDERRQQEIAAVDAFYRAG